MPDDPAPDDPALGNRAPDHTAPDDPAPGNTTPDHTAPDHTAPDRGGPRLRGDCASCFALCCVAPAFTASADFAIDKPAGQPCPNLAADFRCGSHSRLRDLGFPGCTVYDCFGAGQQVAQVTFAGRDWRRAPETARTMFAVFGVMRALHELLWYLAESRALPAAGPLHAQLDRAYEKIERLTRGRPKALLALDVAAHRHDVNALLLQTSELARAGAGTPRHAVRAHAGDRRRPPDHRGAGEVVGPGADLRGADLVGARLAGADLRGASLRGALLLGADLTGADLTLADVTGADLRGADLRGADLAESLFLTQAQLDAARGDGSTHLPASVNRPHHWVR